MNGFGLNPHGEPRRRLRDEGSKGVERERKIYIYMNMYIF